MARMSPVLSRFAASDGLLLHRCDWPCVGETKGTLLVVHGLGEHIGRYDRVAMRLNAAGWHVAGYDQRGHGQSEGARGAVGRRDSLLFDLGRVVDTVRGERGGPLILLGHSMGGLIAARWSVPTLLLWAGSDRCVAPAGSQAFADAAPPGVVRSQCFDTLYHEIFNEPEQDEVFFVLLGWLAERVGQ